MNSDDTSNDNKELDSGVLDPDRHYVGDYMAEACAHFKERGIHRETVAGAMLDELFKMLDGNPFRSPGDEGALRADQQLLWRVMHRVAPMSKLWDQAWIRTQYEKRPTYHFNRAAPRPPSALPPRLVAPLPDYSPKLFEVDLQALRLRPGHVYTEKEVLTRFRRRMLVALTRTRSDGVYDPVKRLADAKKRVIGWMRRTQPTIKAQKTD